MRRFTIDNYRMASKKAQNARGEVATCVRVLEQNDKFLLYSDHTLKVP